MQVQFHIPNFFDISTRSYIVAGLVFIATVLSIVVVNIYKNHYLNKKDIKLAKHWVALWVTGSSTFFTYLGWLVAIASANSSLLSGLPYVGKHALQVIGLAYVVYNVRLNKVYKGIVSGLTSYSKSDDSVATPVDAGVTTSVQSVNTLSDDDRTFEIKG